MPCASEGPQLLKFKSVSLKLIRPADMMHGQACREKTWAFVFGGFYGCGPAARSCCLKSRAQLPDESYIRA